MIDYVHWTIDGGGWDGTAEVTHELCGARLPIVWGERIDAILNQISQHECTP